MKPNKLKMNLNLKMNLMKRIVGRPGYPQDTAGQLQISPNIMMPGNY